MAAIAHAQVLETTEQTHTGDTNWTTVATLSAASFAANGVYLIIAMAQLGGSVSTERYGGRVRAEEGGPIVLKDSEMTIEPAAGSFKHGYAYFTKYTQPGAAVDIVFQMKTLSAASQVRCDTINIIAIRLDADLVEGADWVYNENTTIAGHSFFAVFADYASITFTPGESGDWLILANPSYAIGNTAISVQYHINHSTGGTTIPEFTQEGEHTDETLTWMLTRVFTLTAVSQTFSVAGRDDAQSRTANRHASSRIFALRLSAFKDHAFFWNGDEPGVEMDLIPTFTEVGTLTPTPTATADWLLLATASYQPTSTNDQPYFRIQDSGTTIPTGSDATFNTRAGVYDTTDRNPLSTMALVASVPQSAQDWDLDGTGAVNPSFQQHRSFVGISMELAAAAGGVTIIPAPITLPMAIPAPTVGKGTLTLTPAPVAMPITAVQPAVGRGTPTIAPSPITIPLAIPAPTVGKGTLTLTPAPVALPLVVVQPTVIQAGVPIVITPAPVPIPMTVVAPVVGKGTLTITPPPVAAPIVVKNPAVITPFTVTPSPVAMPITPVAPLVVRGSPPLAPAPIALPILVSQPSVSAPSVGTVLVGNIWRGNPSEYPPGATYALEVELEVDSVIDTAKAELFNLTLGTLVAGSSVTTSNTTKTLLRSSTFTLESTQRDYQVLLSGTLGSARWHASKIRIVNP